MIKIVLIILCVLLFIGMLGLDCFISKDIKRSSKDKKIDNNSEKK